MIPAGCALRCFVRVGPCGSVGRSPPSPDRITGLRAARLRPLRSRGPLRLVAAKAAPRLLIPVL